jgi:hypothetical protein
VYGAHDGAAERWEWNMSKVVETREYVDGHKTLVVEILDNGCCAFHARLSSGSSEPVQAAVSSTVLRELADKVDAAKASAA